MGIAGKIYRYCDELHIQLSRRQFVYVYFVLRPCQIVNIIASSRIVLLITN